ncbi:hypothetical protein INR49_003860, partial [Caranx melampygus]
MGPTLAVMRAGGWRQSGKIMVKMERSPLSWTHRVSQTNQESNDLGRQTVQTGAEQKQRGNRMTEGNSSIMVENSITMIISQGLISSASSNYEVEEVLGCGTFGVVAQCIKLTTNETVALKLLQQNSNTEEAKAEEAMLKKLMDLDAHKFNIVRWNESFTFEGHYCLEFEKLDISLYELMQNRQPSFLQLQEIRPIVQQLAVALDFLKCLGILHADLKPENIMMVDHVGQPLKIKIIDFGLACEDTKQQRGLFLQTLWYRSPEVLVGAPISEAIDMWSLGCIAFEMFTGAPLFKTNDEHDMVEKIVDTIGHLPDHMLDVGWYTKRFYFKNRLLMDPQHWKLLPAVHESDDASASDEIASLVDLIKASDNKSENEDPASEQDLDKFVDLLTQMLNVDSAERITPRQTLQHPFITMEHLMCAFSDSPYVKSCVELMNACEEPSFESEETSHSTASPAENTAPNEDSPAGLSCKAHSLHRKTIIMQRNSPFKRKRDADDVEDRPHITPAKRVRTRQPTPFTEATVDTSPVTPPQLKDDDVESKTSTPKKRKIDLSRELTDCVTVHSSASQYMSRNAAVFLSQTNDQPSSPLFLVFFSRKHQHLQNQSNFPSHFCLAVGHKVGLCGEEVLAVAVASAAVELVRLQHGTLGPLVPVGLPPAHCLSPVPTLQPLPHPMPGRDCVGTVCQWAAHCSRAGAKSGLGDPGDTQGRATWHGPRHVCQGSSSESWRLATVAVGMSVGAVGAVNSVAVAAFWFLAVRLQSPYSSSTSYVSFCWEGGDGGDGGHLCDVGGHWLWGQWTKGSHRSQGGHR